MRDLIGKSILLFVPNGRGIYGSAISNEFEKRGAEVLVYDERPSQSTIIKVAIRLAKNLMAPYFNNYISKIILTNGYKHIDYVIIVRGEAFTSESVVHLKKAFQNARFVLYLWDSVKNIRTTKLFNHFDRVFSFDMEDIASYPSLIHRPFFFISEYRKIGKTLPGNIDVLFIGTAHSDRYGFINSLKSDFKAKGLVTFFYFYIPSRLIYFQKKLTDKSFWRSHMSEFNFKMIPAAKAAEYLGQARCSLDLQHPLQTGLTIRTFEVLGAKRKLITTNKAIKTYDFYDENNILVIDRDHPVIDKDFISSPYQELDHAIYEKYSIEAWVDEILR